MQPKPDAFESNAALALPAYGDVVSPHAEKKLGRVILAEEVRITHVGLASRKIADDYPHLAAWLCLAVRPRCEFSVEEAMRNADIDALVPRRKGEETRRRHRVVEAPMLPVLPGYVLVRCVPTNASVQGLLTFDRDRRVVGIVGDPERPFRIPFKAMMKFIEKASEGAYDYRVPEPVAYALGERVRITDGPFAGFPASVLDIDYASNRLRVEVMIFGRETPAELDIAQVEKV